MQSTSARTSIRDLERRSICLKCGRIIIHEGLLIMDFGVGRTYENDDYKSRKENGGAEKFPMRMD